MAVIKSAHTIASPHRFNMLDTIVQHPTYYCISYDLIINFNFDHISHNQSATNNYHLMRR